MSVPETLQMLRDIAELEVIPDEERAGKGGGAGGHVFLVCVITC